MEKVYELHQHTHCVLMHIQKEKIAMRILPTSNRLFYSTFDIPVQLETSISYYKQKADVTYVGRKYGKEGVDSILIDNFRDGLYNLFKKNEKTWGEEDKETWDEEDKFFMKAVSDYLLLAVKETMEKKDLKIENFDILHYAFVVPSEWKEEIRDDIIRPIFVQSGLISNQDHQDRLLFLTDIEAICYTYSFKRGQNTILCRLSPEREEIIIKFDLIQTTTTLFDIPSAKLFPKVMKSTSVSVNLKSLIKDFLKESIFPAATTDDGGVREFLSQLYQDQILKDIIVGINSPSFTLLESENRKKDLEKKNWITFKKEWMLSKYQKKFIKSLRPAIIFAGIGTFLLGYMKDILSNNFTKNYEFLLLTDDYNDYGSISETDMKWLKDTLEYNRCSLNSIVTINRINSRESEIKPKLILDGAGVNVFEAIQHSDMYCKPRVVSSVDLTTSSSVFLNSKPDAIISLDISLKSTLLTCSILDENGLIQHIYDHDYLIGDKHLPPLGNFYTFSNITILNVKEKFISFAERYLLGDFTANNYASIKKDILLEMKAILAKDLFDGEVLVSTDRPKYIKAFILMYVIYVKEEILYKFFDKFMPDQINIKIGYDVSIEAMILNKTLESKDNLRDIIYASGLVPKHNHSKKLRITTQGERILPAIQKSLKLELSLKSYFLLCQLHEDYVQLSLHQVVTAPSPKEKEQESIIVQDEIIPIQNIYDSLCSNMWCNLQQDSSLIELCKIHNTSDVNESPGLFSLNIKNIYDFLCLNKRHSLQNNNTSDSNKALDLFSSKIKKEFFMNLKHHVLDNILQNNPDTQSTYSVNLTSSCDCKVHLTTSDIIDVSFTPVLQDIACTLSASLLNKGLFGNYINIDYLFSFIRFNNNPQLQHAFARILEEEADDFNLEVGIDTSCLVVPELFSQLLQPIIMHQPLCYKDFKTGALQQACGENYVFSINEEAGQDACLIYKSKVTDTNMIECDSDITLPILNKGDIISNVRSDRSFYLRYKNYSDIYVFKIAVYRLGTTNYLKDDETLSLEDNIYQHVGDTSIIFDGRCRPINVEIPVMVSISYVSYTSSLLFSGKIVGTDTGDEYLTGVIETGEPLTLTKF